MCMALNYVANDTQMAYYRTISIKTVNKAGNKSYIPV